MYSDESSSSKDKGKKAVPNQASSSNPPSIELDNFNESTQPQADIPLPLLITPNDVTQTVNFGDVASSSSSSSSSQSPNRANSNDAPDSFPLSEYNFPIDFTEELRPYSEELQRLKELKKLPTASERTLAEQLVLWAIRSKTNQFNQVIHFLLADPVRSDYKLHHQRQQLENKIAQGEIQLDFKLINYLKSQAIATVKIELLNFYERITQHLESDQCNDIAVYRTLFFTFTQEKREGLEDIFKQHLKLQMKEYFLPHELQETIYREFMTKSQALLPESYETADEKIRQIFCLDAPPQSLHFAESLRTLVPRLESEYNRTMDALQDFIDYRVYLVTSDNLEWTNYKREEEEWLKQSVTSIMQNGKQGIPARFRNAIDNIERFKGLVSVDLVEEHTGSNLVLLALQYGNTALYNSLDNNFKAKKYNPNKKELTAAFYYTCQQKQEIANYDREGQALRELEQDIFHYIEKWYAEDSEEQRLKNSKNFFDMIRYKINNFFTQVNRHKLRGPEAQKYMDLIARYSTEKIPSNFFSELSALIEEHQAGFFENGSRLKKIGKKYQQQIATREELVLLRNSPEATVKELLDTRERLKKANEENAELLKNQQVLIKQHSQEISEARQREAVLKAQVEAQKTEIVEMKEREKTQDARIVQMEEREKAQQTEIIEMKEREKVQQTELATQKTELDSQKNKIDFLIKMMEEMREQVKGKEKDATPSTGPGFFS
ncbi:hypothetical protein [Legionella fairfieldensis]|uniref:hypothetical protein n=1 Tax=Legionella fairfieldensis TaxID=45064 RepID=UPI00048B2516|nr:hypothetical protein [Legionella fairfieldensis]